MCFGENTINDVKGGPLLHSNLKAVTIANKLNGE